MGNKGETGPDLPHHLPPKGVPRGLSPSVDQVCKACANREFLDRFAAIRVVLGYAQGDSKRFAGYFLVRNSQLCGVGYVRFLSACVGCVHRTQGVGYRFIGRSILCFTRDLAVVLFGTLRFAAVETQNPLTRTTS